MNYDSYTFRNRDVDKINKDHKKRKLLSKAKQLEDKGIYNEAQGGSRRQKKAEKLYRKSEELKAKAKKI